jgi:hypothetical protein
MSLRWNGGVLGKPAFPNTGMWSLPSQLDRRQRSRWPIPLPVTANCIFHIDASQPSTVTLNGSNVSAITDLSASAVTCDQSTAARQPAYVRDVRNGRNVLRFTSASQHFFNLNITIPASHTVFTVWSRDDRQNANIGLGNSPDRYPHIWWTDQAIYQQSNGTATTQTTGGRNNANATGWFYFTTRRNGTTSIRARQNGVNFDVTTGAGVTSAASGSWIYIGRIGSSPSYGQQDIGEIIVYDTNLSDADINLVEGYIAAKWNI